MLIIALLVLVPHLFPRWHRCRSPVSRRRNRCLTALSLNIQSLWHPWSLAQTQGDCTPGGCGESYPDFWGKKRRQKEYISVFTIRKPTHSLIDLSEWHKIRCYADFGALTCDEFRRELSCILPSVDVAAVRERVLLLLVGFFRAGRAKIQLHQTLSLVIGHQHLKEEQKHKKER